MSSPNLTTQTKIKLSRASNLTKKRLIKLSTTNSRPSLSQAWFHRRWRWRSNRAARSTTRRSQRKCWTKRSVSWATSKKTNLPLHPRTRGRKQSKRLPRLISSRRRRQFLKTGKVKSTESCRTPKTTSSAEGPKKSPRTSKRKTKNRREAVSAHTELAPITARASLSARHAPSALSAKSCMKNTVKRQITKWSKRNTVKTMLDRPKSMQMRVATSLLLSKWRVQSVTKLLRRKQNLRYMEKSSMTVFNLQTWNQSFSSAVPWPGKFTFSLCSTQLSTQRLRKGAR